MFARSEMGVLGGGVAVEGWWVVRGFFFIPIGEGGLRVGSLRGFGDGLGFLGEVGFVGCCGGLWGVVGSCEGF